MATGYLDRTAVSLDGNRINLANGANRAENIFNLAP